ncbi:MAG: AsmA family protein [Rhizobiaceae bacterium]
MKKIFVSLFVLALILAGALFILPLLLTSDAMRQEFSSRVSSISGMDIELNGPVNFSIIPDFGVVAEQVKLSAPDQSFSVSAAKIVAGVSFSSIFSGQIEITGLDIRQPEFFIDESISPSPSQNKAAASSGASGENSENKDPFASAVSTLERLAINRLTISDGTFISKAIDDTLSVVTDIEMELRAPSLDDQVELTFSANSDGQHLSLDASIDALRPILQRQPSGINIALKMEPAPHPALSDLTLKGIIQLHEDGSYQISDGRFSTLGHPLRIDALYRPGIRPYGSLSLHADSVELGAIKQAVSFADNNASAENPSSPAGTAPKAAGSTKGLSALAGFDGDLKLTIGSFSMDGAEIRNINLQAVLKQGALKAKLGNATIANGKVSGALNTDFNSKSPTFQGSMTASALDLTDIARLANADIPLKGNLGLNIGYAFRGLDEDAIKNSFNFAGTIGISKGTLSVPALEGADLGKGAGTISELNVQATIKHIQKPVTVKGKLNWQGEAVSFTTQVSPRGFIQDGSGAMTLAIASSKLKAKFAGNMNLSGALNGKASVSTSSLGGVMAWLGQGQNSALRDFAYSGDIRIDPNNFKFSKSSITLNGNRATGSGLLSFVGKPSITTNLSFSSLDISALTGGGSGGNASNNGQSKDTKGTKGTEATGVAASESSPLDLSALRQFDADIQLQANKLGYGKVSAGPVKTTLTVKDGVARLSLPSTAFYGGNVAAEITANGKGETAAISINAKLAGVDASSLFRDAADFDRLEGRLNASIKTNGAGKTTKAFAKSLQGSAGANFTNGAIRGIDIAKIYNNLAVILATGFEERSGDKTEFSELGLSFAIENGVATTNDIKLIGPAVEMDGAGNVDLGEETIDMVLNPKLVGFDQASQSDLSTVKIPVVIKGKLSEPLVYPDLTSVLRNPQAALGALSKLGLNLKGLGGADGKVDLKQLALDKLKDPDAAKKIGKVIEQLIPGNAANTNTNDVLGSLLGKLANPNAPRVDAPVQEAPSNVFEGLIPESGTIAVPASNPNGRPLSAQAAQQPATSPAPAIDVDSLDLEKPINDLLKGIFN